MTYTGKDEGIYTPFVNKYTGRDGNRYTISDTIAMSMLANARGMEHHGEWGHVCVECLEWAEREYLINKINAVLSRG